MKHTKGPWEVRNQRVWNPSLKCGDIAHIYCKSTSKNQDFANDEMGQANAQLIAAAPDLLEAVKELDIAWNTWTELARSQHGNQFDTAVGMAREAIKKAEGK